MDAARAVAMGWLAAGIVRGEVQVKDSSKQLFDRFMLVSFKNVWEHPSLTLVH